MKKGDSFFITSTSTGCMVSLSENSELKKKLCWAGLVPVSSPKEAKLILINTCAVTSDNENSTVKQMKNLVSTEAKIIVMGCFPTINKERFQKDFSGFQVLPANPDIILQELKLDIVEGQISLSPQLVNEEQSYQKSLTHTLILFLRQKKKRLPLIQRFFPYYSNLLDTAIFNSDFANISIGEGCLGNCTYCSIKKARGTFQSRPLELIKNDFLVAYKNGQRQFCLIAGDAGCWGHEEGKNLSHLLAALFQYFPEIHLSLSYLSPQWLIRDQKDLMPYFQDPRIIFIGLPIQSASSRLLELCQRPYEMASLLPLLKKIKNANPYVVIKTDLIDKLPTETAFDLKETRLVLPYFDSIYLQNFSLRPDGKLRNYPPHNSSVFDRWLLHMAIKRQHLKGIFKALRPRL